jgi:ATP-dependent Clp protease adapter protein ClpS/Zn-dependent protease
MADSINDSLKRGMNLWLLRGIGALALVGGMPFVALAGIAVVRLSSRILAEPVFVLAVLAVPALIAAFLLSVGWRLLLNRPNRYQSLLHPVAWWVIAILLMAMGSLLAFMLVSEKRYEGLGVAVFAVLFGLASALIGVRTARGTWAVDKATLSSAVGMNSWSLKIATVQGAPLRIHWSLPVGGLMLSIFSGFRLTEWFYYCLAFLALISIHELGHFAAARLLGLKVFSVDISGLGGQCNVQAPRGIRDTLLVFSAGLLAQCALFLLTLLYTAIFGWPTSAFGKCVVYTFTTYNVFLFVLNLIPGKTFSGLSTDGNIIWKVILHATKGTPHPFPDPIAATRVFPAETSLLALDDFSTPGFTTGVEILNDSKTPMEFVVTTLMQQLQLDREKAIILMLEIHKNGGALVPTAGLDRAEAIAAAVTEAARDQGHQFVCRAVEVRPCQEPPHGNGK